MLASGCVLAALGPAVRADGPLLPSLRSHDVPRETPRSDDLPDDATLQALGARIGAVRLDRRDVFDVDRPEENTPLFRLANWLHVRTREPIIASQLLFQPGDLYDPRLLQESERLLRRNAFLRDATIRPVAFHDGVVDLEVVTQDVWTLNPGISMSRKGGSNSIGLGLEELNLLGSGAELALESKSNVDRRTRLLHYSDRQLLGSWWALSLSYANNSDGHSHSVVLNHPFHMLDARAAGGGSVGRSDRIESLYALGQSVASYRVQERHDSIYAGRSDGLVDGWATRWTVGVNTEAYAVTPLDATALVSPVQRRLVYPWIGLERVEDRFVKTRNNDQIGKTEDLQLGETAQLRLGLALPAFGSDREAVVFDAAWSRGVQPQDKHTWLLNARASGRIEAEGLRGTLIGASARFYLRHSPRVTSYLALAVDRGTGLDPDQVLQLGGDNGLRGYPLRYQSGHGRWLLTAEQRAFTDWYPWRLFNVGGAVFFDMGRAWGGTQPPLPADPAQPDGARGMLRDIGVGLRLGNSRSGLGSVVHIDLAFPLDGHDGLRKVQLLIETRRSF